MPATHNDAILMIELAKWGSMVGIDDASREVFADDFDAEAAEATDQSVSKLLMFGETIGTLVKNGLIDRELVGRIGECHGLPATQLFALDETNLGLNPTSEGMSK